MPPGGTTVEHEPNLAAARQRYAHIGFPVRQPTQAEALAQADVLCEVAFSILADHLLHDALLTSVLPGITTFHGILPGRCVETIRDSDRVVPAPRRYDCC